MVNDQYAKKLDARPEELFDWDVDHFATREESVDAVMREMLHIVSDECSSPVFIKKSSRRPVFFVDKLCFVQGKCA